MGAPRIDVAWEALERRFASSACQIGAALDDWKHGVTGSIARRRELTECMPCNEDNLKLASAPLAGRKQKDTLEGYWAVELPRTKSADRACYAFLQQPNKEHAENELSFIKTSLTRAPRRVCRT